MSYYNITAPEGALPRLPTALNLYRWDVLNMGKGNDLRRDAVLSLVFKLALPAMLAQLVNVLYGIIDRMFIGHIPVVGNIALAGVGVCGPITTLLSSFGNLVGIGGSVMMATSMGHGDRERAKKILSNSFLLLLVLSVALTVVLLLNKREMIYLFGGSDKTYEFANTYLTIYTTGTFFALLALGLNFFISCQGFSVNAMLTVLIGAVSNIILDAVFVPGLGWGAGGAALATVISQMFSCIYAVAFLFGKKVGVRISFGNYDWRMMLKIIVMGISPFIILATDSVIIIAINMILQRFGGADGDMLISAYTITQSYFLLITGPLFGISGGVQPIISFNYGAGQNDRVQKTVKYAVIMGIIFNGIMLVVSQLFAGGFVKFFTEDLNTAKAAVWGIKVFTISVVPLALQYVFVDALTALSKVKISLYLSAFRKIAYVVCALAFAGAFGAAYSFYAEPVVDIAAGIQAMIVFIFVWKRHLKKHDKSLCREPEIQTC